MKLEVIYKMNSKTVTFLLLISLSMVNSASKIDYYNLHNNLFTDYNSDIRPVNDDLEVMSILIDFSLVSISELLEKDQTLVSFGYFYIYWQDDFLSWNETEYDGLENMVVPQKKVWRPDVVVANSVEKRSKLGFDDLPIRLNSVGYVEWEPSNLFQTSCDIDTTYYPFDVQVCTIVLEPMVSKIYELDLVINDPEIDLSDYSPNGQWNLLSAKMVKKDTSIKPSISIELKIERRRTFYVLNLILPILLLSLMGSLTFALPSDSGEKMGLSITVLLAYVVFLTIISDSMPQTSLQISLLGVYITILVALSALSVLLSVPILRLYHTKSTEPVPSYGVWFVRLCAKCRKRKVAVYNSPTKDAEVSNTPKSQNFFEDMNDETVTWEQVSQSMDAFLCILFFILTFIATIIFIALILI